MSAPDATRTVAPLTGSFVITEFPDSHSNTSGAVTPSAASRYELGDEIARGGMGVIYRATDNALGREVAVKVLHDKYAPTSGAARRFADEARIAGQLQHPGIPPIHDLGALPDGRPFLAMKLIKGDTLDDLLKARTNASADRGRFVAVFEQVCQAIAFAHSHRVIHRDLKPANVMVGNYGEVQVMDWGLAKVLGDRPAEMADPQETTNATEVRSLRDSDGSETQSGSVLGTPAFMPPEQAVGAVTQVDEHSDVFGLGAVLAVILTGKPPFVADTAETTRILAAQGKVDECFVRLDVCGADPDLVALCKRCLAPNAGERPADAGVVAKAVAELRQAADERARLAELDRVRAEGAVRAAEVRTAEQRKRRKVQAALGLSFTALLVLGGAFAWWVQDQRRAKEAEDQQRQAAKDSEARDKRTAAERVVNQAVEDAVSRFGRANGAGRDLILWAEARAAALQAQARATESDAPPEVRERIRRLLSEIEQVERNRRLVATLLEIQASMGDELTGDGNQDFAGANARYTRAFQEYGSDLFAVTPEQGADLLRNLGGEVRVELAAAIDDWGYVRFVLTGNKLDDTRRLFGVTRLLDPDPVRNSVRDIVVARNHAALNRLAEEMDPAAHPVQTVNLVGIYLQYGDVTSSIRFLQKAQPHHPGDFQINHNLAWFLNVRSRFQEALPYCVAAIAVRPKSAVAWNDQGIALQRMGRDADALAAFRRVALLAPKNFSSRIAIGNLLSKAGEKVGGQAAYTEARNLDPNNAQIRSILGAALRANGDLNGAVAEYREAARLEPKNSQWHDWIAFLLLLKGDAHGALPSAREAVRLDPTVALTRWNFARALQATGDLEEAVAQYKEALRLAPKITSYQTGLRHAERLRELLLRLPDVAAGRAKPASRAEALEFAELCTQPLRKQYVLAVRLYAEAIAITKAGAGTIQYRAASAAAMAAAGKDAEINAFGVEEWGLLTDLAHRWLRANLAFRAGQVKTPTAWPTVRNALTHWKADPNLIAIRDPEWLGAMPPADRKRWEVFWLEVDTLLAAVTPELAPPPREVKKP
jgi:tetratricopeptide (TPR) repeat protein